MALRIFAVALTVFTFTTVSQAQQNLVELAQEGQVEWMIGNWSGQADDGTTISLSYTWDLNKHLIRTHLKGADMELKGMTFVDPEDNSRPKYMSVDNRGRMSSGTWDAENGESVLKYDSKRTDGDGQKGGVVHKMLDQDTMKVQFHALDYSGELVEPERFSITLRRKK